MPTLGKVLLADDSPHAQRMGERILREEGYEVVTVTDGETAIMRVKDVDPDVVIVDAFLPQVSGYDLCGYIKKQQQYSHVRVLLTSTALEKVDEDQAYKAGADGQLKKPFEASVMLKSLKDLIGGSDKDKKKRAGTTLDLNGPIEDHRSSEQEATETRESAAEKPPVSALQAWLQEHDTDATQSKAAAADAAEPPRNPLSALADRGEISNPRLLRKPEEEAEDLSLRNNPVARLRNTGSGSSTGFGSEVARGERPSNEPASTGNVRTFRVPSQEFHEEEEEAGDASEERPVGTPKKSLLAALEEFERATALVEEPEVPAPPVAAAAAIPLPEVEEAPVVEETGGPARTAAEARREPQSVAVALAEVEEAEVEELPPAVEPEAEVLSVSAAEVAEVAEPAVLAQVAPVAAAATVSLAEANVRLDEEEIRAAVEIAVSASMPSIVDEVTRCVLLVLEARYQQSRDSHSAH